MKPVKDESELTEEILERELELLAIAVEYVDPRAMLLFESVERKLAEVRARGKTRERVRQRLGATGSAGTSGTSSW